MSFYTSQLKALYKPPQPISDNQIQAIRCDAKGNIEIHVTLVDEASATPITGTMTMAWFPNSSGNGKLYLYILFNLCLPKI